MTVNNLIQMEAIVDSPNIDYKLINYLIITIEHWNSIQC